MLLAEIREIPPNPPGGIVNMHEFDIANAKRLTTAKNLPLYHTTNIRDRDAHLYFLTQKGDSLEEGNIVSYITGKGKNIAGTSRMYLEVKWSETNDPHKGNRYGEALYNALVDKVKIGLISDNKQTPAAKRIWASATKVYDSDNDTMLRRNQVPEDKIYIGQSGTNKEAKRYILIWENVFLGGMITDLSESVEDIWKDMEEI